MYFYIGLGSLYILITFNTKKMDPIQRARELLKSLFSNHQVDEAHGIIHADKVAEHARRAVEVETHVFPKTKENIILAALLHDADDKKFFNTPDFNNAIAIVKLVDPDAEFSVWRMIRRVSVRDNKHMENYMEYEEIPAICDRLEAIGEVGIARCYIYTKAIGNPLFTEKTPRVTCEKELWQVATPERFANYKGNSDDMISHYYDKLVHLDKDLKSNNPYLKQEIAKRKGVMLEFLFNFGRTGTLDIAYLELLASIHSK